MSANMETNPESKWDGTIHRRQLLSSIGTGALGLAAAALVGCAEAKAEITDIPQIPEKGTADLASSIVTPTPDAKPIVDPEKVKDPVTLRDCGDMLDIGVGTYLIPRIFPNSPEWRNIASKQFNLAVNSVFWQLMFPKPDGKFDFTLPDYQTDFAIKNNMEVRGEALVFPYLVPDWLRNDKSMSGEKLRGFMKDAITTTMNHYKGKINTWVVLNEAGVVPPYNNNDIFTQRIGPDYIESAFQTARDTDPSAKLIYNDTDSFTQRHPKYNNARRIVDSLVGRGLIDGVGLELNIDASKVPSKEDIIAGIKSYGLPVYVTELDVDLRNVGGNQDERFALQATIYKQVLEGLLESEACKQITFWGFGDKYSWLEQPGNIGSPNADPTLYDDDLKPKPAFFSSFDTLKNAATSSSKKS